MGTLPTETLRSTRVRWREVCLRVRFLECSEISLGGHLSRCSEVSLASSGSAVGSVTSQGLRRTATRPQAQHATAVSSDHGSETRPTAFASSHPSCAFGSPSARLSVSREPCPSIRRTEVRCLVGQYYQQQMKHAGAVETRDGVLYYVRDAAALRTLAEENDLLVGKENSVDLEHYLLPAG